MDVKRVNNFSDINAFLSRHDKSVEVLSGDTYTVIEGELYKACPYQNILFITLNSKKTEYKSFIDLLQDKNFKVTTISLENKPLSLDNLSVICSTAEEVRAVVCLDYELFDYAIYCSYVKEAKLFLSPNTLNQTRVLKNKLKIINGQFLDELAVNPSATIIFDTNRLKPLKNQLKKAYESFISLSLSLIEYRLLRFINLKNTYREAYESIKHKISSIFDFTACSESTRYEIIAYNTLCVNLIDYAIDGEILSETVYKSCFEFGLDSEVLDLSIKVLALSNYAFTELISTKKVPDYNERITYLKEKYGNKLASTIGGFLNGAKIFMKNENAIKKFFVSNKEELEGLVSSLIKAKKISNNLSSEKNELKEIDIINAIKYLGDLDGNVNLCTFLREKGIMELI